VKRYPHRSYHYDRAPRPGTLVRPSRMRTAWRFARSAAAPCQASQSNSLKPLGESLARIFKENQKLALRDPHHVDVLLRRLASQAITGIFLRDKECPWPLPLVTLCALHQLENLGPSGLRGSRWNQCYAQDETTRRIHQRKAVEVSVLLGPDGDIVQAKRYPGLVDFELVRMKHAITFPGRLFSPPLRQFVMQQEVAQVHRLTQGTKGPGAPPETALETVVGSHSVQGSGRKSA